MIPSFIKEFKIMNQVEILSQEHKSLMSVINNRNVPTPHTTHRRVIEVEAEMRKLGVDIWWR